MTRMFLPMVLLALPLALSVKSFRRENTPSESRDSETSVDQRRAASFGYVTGWGQIHLYANRKPTTEGGISARRKKLQRWRGQISTRDYFNGVSNIPMNLYNTYVCSMFKTPLATEQARKKQNSKTYIEYTWLLYWLCAFGKDTEFRSESSYDQSYKNMSLKRTKKQLIQGLLSGTVRESIRSIMLAYLDVPDLEDMLREVYLDKLDLAFSAELKLAPFYAGKAASCAKDLVMEDKKRLMADLVLSTNGRFCCSSLVCVPEFQDVGEVVEAVAMTGLLPCNMSSIKKVKAVAAIKLLIEADLTSVGVSGLLGNLVMDFSMDIKDAVATCHALVHAKASSYYCGVRDSAKQLYEHLDCDCVMAYYESYDVVTPDCGDHDGDSSENDVSGEDRNTPPGEYDGPGEPDKTAVNTTTTTTTTEASAPLDGAVCGLSDLATRLYTVQSNEIFIAARIVGGFVAGTCTVYPWMVRLLVESTGQSCGGAILDERHILTAAHCTLFTDGIRVFVGDYDRSAVEGTEQIFDVPIVETNNTFVHPDYDYGAAVNDIAVVTLNEAIDMSAICATPICLDADFELTEGIECTTAGWGATSEDDRIGSTLMMTVSMPTFDSDDCLDLFPQVYMTDPDTQICAGEPDEGGVDACGGDSGSPLFCSDSAGRWVAVGVVAYGDGCARAGFAGIYSDVRKYVPWIQSQLLK